jgi:hypothetical protein
MLINSLHLITLLEKEPFLTQEEKKAGQRQLGLKLAVLALILISVILAVLAYFEESSITKFLLTDSLTITHLAGYIGAFWIAIFTPIYFVLKRRSPRHLKSMLKIHVLGNLLAFALITTHYVHREVNSVFFGTGIVLYIALLSLVVTGIIKTFNIAKGFRSQVSFVHTSMTTAFYLILIIHIIGTFVRI